MKYFLPFLVLVLSLHPLPAADDPGEFTIRSTRPLAAAQLERLRQLVVSDPEAAALFAKLKEEAVGLTAKSPRPIAVIHYEGLVNTDPRRIETVSHLREMDDIAALFNYWQASGDEDAADALRRFTIAWAKTYRPTGNDVNENKFLPIFDSYAALRETFAEEDRAIVDAWMREMARLHAGGIRNSKRFTNRFAKRVRMLATFGLIFDNEEWNDTASDGFRQFVINSLRGDGSSADLEHRDSLTYHNSALRSAIGVALVAGDDGPALYTWTSPAGASVKKSVDFVVPYATGSKQREEWVNTTVELDRRRAAEGLEKYQPGRLFDPADALPLMEEAAVFDPALTPVALQLHGGNAERFPSWTMVLNATAHPEPRP
jgi:hypothetical protein